ncbi:MAG: MFS transporter [Micrococcales bacterium]
MTKIKAKPNYTPFVVLQIVSMTSIISGSMMFLIFPWLCIDLTGQASSAGLMVTISSIPGLLISPVIGSIIDKFGRRRVGFITETQMALVTLAFPILVGTFGPSYALILAVAVIRSLVGSGNSTARKSLVPDAAAEAKMSLERANSIHESVFAAGFAIGPAIGAIAIQWVGAVNAFWISGFIGLFAGLATLFIRVLEQHEEQDPDENRKFFSYAIQGFAILFKTPSVLLLMTTIMTLALIYMPTEMVVLPVYYNSLGDSQTLGFLISIMAGFTTVGSLLFERLAKLFSFSTLLRVALLGVAFAMVPMSLLPPSWMMFVFGAILGLAWGPLPPLLNTVIQRKVPANKRGRVFSLEMTIWTAGPMISMSLAGMATDAWGVRLVYPILAALVLLAMFFVITRKTVAQLNTSEHA